MKAYRGFKSHLLRQRPLSPSLHWNFVRNSPGIPGVSAGVFSLRRFGSPNLHGFWGLVSADHFARSVSENSLIWCVLQGILRISGYFDRIWTRNRKQTQWVARLIPCACEQGIKCGEQGSEHGLAGNETGGSGISDFHLLNPKARSCSLQSSAMPVRKRRSTERSGGWVPSRIAAWIRGDRKASCNRVPT